MSGDVSIERTPGAGLVLRCRRCDITEAILSDGGFARLLQQHGHESAPWRFDVPVVPAHVTAIKDCDGDVWLLTAGLWHLAHDGFHNEGSDIRDALPHAPLVECPDPRAAS